jgi:hypothetical protein
VENPSLDAGEVFLLTAKGFYQFKNDPLCQVFGFFGKPWSRCASQNNIYFDTMGYCSTGID